MKNGKENNSINTSSDKPTNSHTRKPGHVLDRNGNLKRETVSLLTAAQNATTRTISIKERIEETQKIRNLGYAVIDETISHIISECSKLTQKEYEARHDWVIPEINWELCKKFKFYHTKKWDMYNLESVQ